MRLSLHSRPIVTTVKTINTTLVGAERGLGTQNEDFVYLALRASHQHPPHRVALQCKERGEH